MSKFKVKTWLNAKQVRAAVKQASTPRLLKAALMVEREAKISMKKGGKARQRGAGGRFVKGTKAGRSKPGKPPFVQLGTLRASVKTAKTILGYVVGPVRSAFYGKFLEFGTRFMAPRPFMRPAFVRAKRKFPKLFRGLKLKQTRAGRLLDGTRGPIG